MADINDYMDQMAERSQKLEAKHPLSFMSGAFQNGAEAFLRGASFSESQSKDWQEGWNFAMKWAFMNNMMKYVFGGT